MVDVRHHIKIVEPIRRSRRTQPWSILSSPKLQRGVVVQVLEEPHHSTLSDLNIPDVTSDRLISPRGTRQQL
jgi:hypothetical protein